MFSLSWNLLFGIFFTLLKTSMSSGLSLVFPSACYDDAADVTYLKKEKVDIKILESTPAWMNVANHKLRQTYSVLTCRKTFDLSRLVKRNAKLFVSVKMEQHYYYSCPFKFLLYSGNSLQPIQVIPCWMLFDKVFHWPNTNFTFALEFNPMKADSILEPKVTILSVRAGACRNCFKMDTSTVENTWRVQLPNNCATRVCLEYKPFSYTFLAFSGLYINKPSHAPCYVTFDIKDERDKFRVKTCLQLSPKKNGAVPYDNKLLLVLTIDGLTYMEFTTTALDEFWCLPDSWLRHNSMLTLQWLGGSYVCDKPPWILHVKSNFSDYNYFSSCDRTLYQEKNITHMFTTTTIWPDLYDVTSMVDHQYPVDQQYLGVMKWAIISAGLCTAFVICIIVVVCVIRRRRLRAAPSTNQNIGQRSQHRCHQNRAENNTSDGLTQLEELTPVIPTAPNLSDMDRLSTDLDPPPPYPSNAMAPPSYEEVCHMLPVQSQDVHK